MARVNHVKAARKDYPQHGIKKGQEYWWIQHRYGAKQFFIKPPKPSQTTQSEFLSAAYELEERIDELKAEDWSNVEDLKDELDSIISVIRDLGSDQEDKYNNVPENFQGSEGAELLQRRAEVCEEWATELENAKDSIEDGPKLPEQGDEESDEDYEKRITTELMKSVKESIKEAIETFQNASNPDLE